METEYRNRGILHKIANVTKLHKSSNTLVRRTTKTLLYGETALLFAKDVVTNRLVGKEFHVKFERKLNRSGKYRTHIRLIRVEADKRESGIIHKMVNVHRFVEGDVPKVLQGIHIRNPVTKTGGKLAVTTLLSAEKLLQTGTSFAFNQFRQKMAYSTDTNDSEKAVLGAVSRVKELNQARKYLINYRRRISTYRQSHQSYKIQKAKLKTAKQHYKKEKKPIKAEYKKINRQWKQIEVTQKGTKSFKSKKIVFKSKIKYQKKLLKTEKKTYKTQKKLKKVLRKERNKHRFAPRFVPSFIYKPLNPVFVALNPVGATTKHLTKQSLSKAKNTILSADQNNDMVKALDKTTTIAKSSYRTANSVRHKLNVSQRYSKHQKNKLHKRENKLKSKNDLLRKNKRTYIKNRQRPLQSTKKKVQGAVKNLAKDFLKFAFKFLGAMIIPVVAFFICFLIFMMMFTGTNENGSSLLATYNAKDMDISLAEEEYTKIAYDFNQKILKCSTADWKNGLSSLGVDTSSYHNKPDNYYFGVSDRFSTTPVYDYDPDKFDAFLCAYFSEKNSDGNVENWKWQSSYKTVLQKLFDTEYTFQHRYEDYSGWVHKDSYTFLGGGGVHSSYYTVKNNITKSQMEIDAVPSEIYAFSRDNKIHYNIDTLEVLNANDHDKQTGWFIQDQRYFVADPNGHSVAPFYTQIVNPTTGVFQYWAWQNGTNADGSLHYEHRGSWYWTDTHQEIYYLVNSGDAHKWNSTLNDICLINFYQKYEWRTDCSLYYTVKQNCTFEEAIKIVLNSKDTVTENQRARLNFYTILTQANENGRQTYGNHQKMNAPVLSKSLQRLIDTHKLLHHYGYDMQKWNSEHCTDFHNSHKGMDIIANINTDVYATIDGTISNIDTANHTLTITTPQKVDFWYEKNFAETENHNIQIIYANIQPTVRVGDTVTAGQKIGKVTGHKCCTDGAVCYTSENFLHITVKIQYGAVWHEVDPRLLIYRNDSETH